MGYSKYRSPYLRGKVINSDYTLQIGDSFIGIDASSGDITIKVPDASTISDSDYPYVWNLKRMDSSINNVIITLENPNDSLYGAVNDSVRLYSQGDGIEILLTAAKNYAFTVWSGKFEIANPSVTTLKPTQVDTTLNMRGSLNDLASFDSVLGYFRYRDITSGGDWIETTKQTLTSTGEFTDTATIISGNTYEVQAVIEDNYNTHYGAVLTASKTYYSSLSEAQLDGLVWGSNIDEGSGSISADVFGNNDITWYGITWDSDTINGTLVNKVVFGSTDYGEAGFVPQLSNKDYTILIQIRNNNNSGDHTMLNFGRNNLSLASDNTSIQLEVNGSYGSWSNSTPTNAIINLWIVVDRGSNRTMLYDVTSSSVTQRIDVNDVPDGDASYVRIARGTSGDSNHQDNEYLDDGEVRSIWIWEGAKPESFMQDVIDVLDNKGGSVV